SLASAADISFNRDIRPILTANCLACHGQDATKREANLRLDIREIATAPAKGGLVAIVPGKPEASELIKRVTASHPNVRMPHAPGKKLPFAVGQIDLLRQ